MPTKTEVKDLEKSRKQLIISEIDEQTLQKAEESVLKELSQSMKIKGFRPGKIPVDMVKEQVDEAYVKAQAIQKAIPEVANDVIQEQKIRIIGEPRMEIQSMEPMKVVIEFDVFPTLTLGKYEKIKVKKDKKTATDKEVEQAVEEIQKRLTEFEAVDRAAKKDDRVELDFDGFRDGVAMEGGSSKNHPIIIGSNMMIPGFEEEIVGLKAGDEKEFDITFPKDYHAKNLAGQKATFKIKVHTVSESKAPELDEAFVEKVSGKKGSIDDWKKELKEQIQKEHDQLYKREVEEAYYDELIKVCEIEIPAALIEDEKNNILTEIKQQVLRQGMSYDHYLKATGKTEEQLLESFDKQASDRITLKLALQEISDVEKIEVSDVEVEERLNDLLKDYPDDQKDKLKQQYQPGSNAYLALQHQMKMQKTLEKILPAG